MQSSSLKSIVEFAPLALFAFFVIFLFLLGYSLNFEELAESQTHSLISSIRPR